MKCVLQAWPKKVLLSFLQRRAMDIQMQDVQNIFRLPTPAPLLLAPSVESYDVHHSQSTPLIIDNGSTTLRWGFSTSSVPQSGTNAVAKYKERRSNKPLLLFGEGIDSESGAKGQTKTPWEGDVLLNFDALVCICPHRGVT
jgi:actin-related protein 5